MPATKKFEGTLTTVTPDGRFGIVTVKSKVFGKQRVVIGASTRGRAELLNGHGALEPGEKVKGTAEDGTDAARAISIRAVG